MVRVFDFDLSLTESWTYWFLCSVLLSSIASSQSFAQVCVYLFPFVLFYVFEGFQVFVVGDELDRNRLNSFQEPVYVLLLHFSPQFV